MDSDNKFWAIMWAEIIIGFLGLVFAITLYNVTTQEHIQMAIKNGADPIAAKCALAASSTSALCIAYIAKR